MSEYLENSPFQNALGLLIKAQVEHIERARSVGIDSAMSPLSFLRDYCTLRVQSARSIGVTSFVTKLGALASSSIVMMKAPYLRDVNFVDNPLAKISSLDYLRRLQGSKEIEPNTRFIFVDNPSLVEGLGSYGLHSEFYYAAVRYTKLQMIVALGT